MTVTNLMEIDNISFSAGPRAGLVKVSGYLQEGGVLIVSGPSGSGKTTLLRVVTRFKEANQGEVLLRGDSWRSFTPVNWRRKVHYLAQKPVIFDGTVLQNLARPFELAAVRKEELQFDRDYAAELMEQVLLSPQLLDQDARTLSGGEVSRMALIRTILAEPQVILLDEPLAALDRKSASAVMDLVTRWLNGKPGRGLVLVSHVGDFADLPRLTSIKLQAVGGEADE